MDITFHFDPACPWTWRASRWLVDVAPHRDVTVHWRAFSLSIVNDGKVPEQWQPMMTASSRALRLVEALRADHRNDDIGRFYAELGARTHEAGEAISEEVVLAAAGAAEVPDAKRILDDASWDEAVRASHNLAMAAAGPDIGSPVFTVAGVERGMHGPILGEVPPTEEGLRVFDAVVPLLHIPVFFEVKRGRANPFG
jgi:predicted DsbA family dithiol-disulfide isomerase